MRVVEETPERLLLTHTPWALRAMVWGLAVAFAAIAAFEPGEVRGDDGIRLVIAALAALAFALGWWFLPRVGLLFDRRAGVFEQYETRIGFRHAMRYSWPLSAVRRARLEATWDDGARLTRPVIETGDGVHPIERGYGGDRQDALVDRINAWLGADV